MNATPSPTDRECPFCAETIKSQAIKCRFCGSMLVDEGGNSIGPPVSRKTAQPEPPARPSLFWALFANVLCPGLGSWRLGARIRGFILGAVVFLALVLWLNDIIPAFTRILEQAIRTGRAEVPRELVDQIEQNVWYDVMFWTYLFSFLDVLYLFYTRPASSPSQPVRSDP